MQKGSDVENNSEEKDLQNFSPNENDELIFEVDDIQPVVELEPTSGPEEVKVEVEKKSETEDAQAEPKPIQEEVKKEIQESVETQLETTEEISLSVEPEEQTVEEVAEDQVTESISAEQSSNEESKEVSADESNSTEQVKEVPEPEQPVEVEIPTEPVVEEQNLQSEVAEETTDEEQDDDDNQIEDEMERKRSKRVIIFLSILIFLLLMLIGGGLWLYFSKLKPILEAPKEVVVVHDTIIKEVQPVVDTVPQIVEDTIPAPVVTQVPTDGYYGQRIANKNKVPTSGWLIGYKATPNEVEAIKIVAEMSYVDGFPCGYYWINDAREGKKLFKVYVGPYKTQEEVEAVFPKIQERVADAHIYSEDKNLLEIYRQQKQVYTAEVEK